MGDMTTEGASISAGIDLSQFYQVFFEEAGENLDNKLQLLLNVNVVASDDDPWIHPDRAASLAAAWGSHFVSAGPVGHINAASGLGWWEEGQELLDRVIRAAGGARSVSEARTILAVNGTEAASASFLGR